MKLTKNLGWALSTASIAAIVLTGCGTGANNTANGTTGGSSTGNAASGNTASGGGGSTAAADKNITIGYTNWAEDVAVTEVWKQLLTQKGYNVTTTELQNGAVFESMAKGGAQSVNVDFDVWLPVTDKKYNQKYGSSLVNLGNWYSGSVKIGLVVPDYVYQSGIKSVADLNANASKFGNQIIGIDAGSGEMHTLSSSVVPGYGLKLNVVSGSSATMLTSLKRAEASKKPVVVTLWSPHWAFSKWKLDYLADPKGLFGKSEHIQTDANKTWAGSHTQVVNWMKNFKMNASQLGQLEIDINNDGQTKGAQEWIQKNQSLTNSWFS